MLDKLFEYSLKAFILVGSISLLYYLPRVYAWFFGRKPQEILSNKKKNRIAVLVPARDESSVIDAFFQSANRQTYDREFFDFHVIVKDPLDQTVFMAAQNNARVHVVNNQNKKGDALDACLKTLLKENKNYYDSYLIIDADCMMHEKCLEEFNNAMASGRQIIQAKKLVKNYINKNRDSVTMATKCNGDRKSVV